jgi:multiple sugar transport system ATP-binding protein
LVLGVRPEQIDFTDDGLPGVVFGAEYFGTTQIVTVTTAHGTLRARVPADLSVRVGQGLGVAFRPEKISLFDKASGRAISTELRKAAPNG